MPVSKPRKKAAAKRRQQRTESIGRPRGFVPSDELNELAAMYNDLNAEQRRLEAEDKENNK